MEQQQVAASQLLRPNQQVELQAEVERLESALADPKARLEDRGAAQRQLKKSKRMLEQFTPKPYTAEQIDVAVRREKELREKLTAGMLTQEEMRRAPAGAVGRHIAWEKKHKRDISEWKELRLRIHHDSQDPDIANLEQFRPSGSGSLNMDTARIPQKTQYHFPDHIEAKNLADDETRARWKAELEAHLKAIEVFEAQKNADKPSVKASKSRKKEENKE